jgi:hypothetical protein
VLFVIDNSPSMVGDDRQVERLAAELGKLIERIVVAAPGFEDMDSVPIEDVHFGVVTTDVGSGSFSVPTCESSEYGDDGVLQGLTTCAEGAFPSTDCPSGRCPWVWHLNKLSADGCHQANFSTMELVACVLTGLRPGCGFIQPLDAMLRALTQQTQPGKANEGFLRPDARLMIFFVGDSDDCSAIDPALYDPERGDLGELNSRCESHPELLVPVEHYAQALRALVDEGRTIHVDVSVIGGLPDGESWRHGGDRLEALAGLMEPDPMSPGRSLPLCDGLGFQGRAPLRLLQLSMLMGSWGRQWFSICREGWAEVVDVLFSAILPGVGWCPTCPMKSGDVEGGCHMVETLPDDRPCPHLVEASKGRPCGPGWHLDLGLDDQGRRRCEILSADRDGDGEPDSMPEVDRERCMGECQLPGWVVESIEPERNCVFFHSFFEAMMSPRSLLRLECLGAPCEE